MKQLIIPCLLSLLLGIFLIIGPFGVEHARAETRYVTDMIYLSLREGPGNEFGVIKTLRSDTPVEVLEEEEKFMKIRTEGGEEGWVGKQYITTNTPKPVIITGLKAQMEVLKERVSELETVRTSTHGNFEAEKTSRDLRMKELEKNLSRWKNDALSTKTKLEDVTQKYDAFLEKSKDVAGLVDQRAGLEVTNADLDTLNEGFKRHIEELEQDNDRLMRNEILQWFLAGSGVFFVGLIIGKLSRKPKRY